MQFSALCSLGQAESIGMHEIVLSGQSSPLSSAGYTQLRG